MVVLALVVVAVVVVVVDAPEEEAATRALSRRARPRAAPGLSIGSQKWAPARSLDFLNFPPSCLLARSLARLPCPSAPRPLPKVPPNWRRSQDSPRPPKLIVCLLVWLCWATSGLARSLTRLLAGRRPRTWARGATTQGVLLSCSLGLSEPLDPLRSLNFRSPSLLERVSVARHWGALSWGRQFVYICVHFASSIEHKIVFANK